MIVKPEISTNIHCCLQYGITAMCYNITTLNHCTQTLYVVMETVPI